MKRIDQLFEQIQRDIVEGKFGSSGKAFLDIRDFSKCFHCSRRVTVELYHKLQNVHLLRLVGKQYFITTGFCSPTSPYGTILHKSPTNRLGMLINDASNPFLGELTNSLCDLTQQSGTELIILNSNGNQELELQLMEQFIDLKCKGVFVCIQISPKQHLFFERYPLPLVVLADNTLLQNCDAVLVNNYTAGKQVAKHLISCGCKSYAYIALENYIDHDFRVRGFCDYLSSQHISLNQENIGIIPAIGASPILKDLRYFVNQLLHQITKDPESLPLGIFCFHDLVAVELAQIVKSYRYLGNRKLNIPIDIMIVGFDDLPIASQVFPTLTTVAYQYNEISKQAYTSMIDYIQNINHRISKFEIPSSLVIRDSTNNKFLM